MFASREHGYGGFAETSSAGLGRTGRIGLRACAQHDRVPGSRRAAGAPAGRRRARSCLRHRFAVRHDPHRHFQPAEPDRHRLPASAALRAGEFRSERHCRFDCRAVSWRPGRAIAVSKGQSQGQARFIPGAIARTAAAVAAASCRRAGAASAGRRATQERRSRPFRPLRRLPVRRCSRRAVDAAGRPGICGGRQGQHARLFRRQAAGAGRGADRALGQRASADGDGVGRSGHQAIGLGAAARGCRQRRRNHRQ